MRVAVLLVALLVAVAMVHPAGGDHVQTDGRSVSFDHKTGNEWWVEVVLGGPDADSVERVQAKDTDGRWVTLEKRDWGAYAASFHIEPGHDVRFRVTWPGGDRVVSCWFTHPEGVEQCRDTTWHQTTIARASANGLVVGDADDDGDDEVYVSTGDGIQVHDLDGTWQQVDTIMPGRAFSELAIGDADNDGAAELYAVSDFNDIYQFRWDEGWMARSTEVPSAGSSSISGLVVGDPDDDGEQEVYAGTITDDAPLIQIRVTSDGFEEEVVATIVGGTRHLALGDGDGDGDVELYNGEGNRGRDGVQQIDHVAGAWTKDQVDRQDTSNGVGGLAVGDGDGAPEVFAARAHPVEAHGVWMSTFEASWSTQKIVDLPGIPHDMVMADGDNDGAARPYVSVRGDGSHDVHQIKHVDGSWQTQRVAAIDSAAESFDDALLRAGDADDDGRIELYVAEQATDGHITMVSQHAPPEPGGSDVVFDSRNGNEWWVQVHITGDTPSRVQAMDTGDPWVELTLRDWGDWAESFHVEPGNDVQYRAMVDGEWVVSCWFTHPEGKAPDGSEACSADGGGETPPPSDFDASFDTPGGNEWWVEVYVDGNEPIAAVDARDDGGDWIALEKKDWGAWAKSFHVEDGSIVEFRATSGDGDRVVSDGYVWPSGEPA